MDPSQKTSSTTLFVFHHLLSVDSKYDEREQIDEGGVEKARPPEHEVALDGGLAIIAGADTTSSVLAGIFGNLVRHRDVYDRLRSEIDNAFPLGEGDPFDAGKLGELPYLNAVL